MMRLGILGSTRGTNLLALLTAREEQQLAATINLVVSNKPDALILERAEIHGIPKQYVNSQGLSREQYDQKISDLLRHHEITLVVLIGYMRILSAAFVTAWQQKIINVHPSLLPAFAGKMDLDVHRAVLAAGVKETGCTVHYVTEEVDAGPIVLQKRCPVFATDTPETLKQRVQQLEGDALIAAINQLSLENKK
ncbi:MAG TPA: phosphoribosylglycinamide formyltransferase [Gammaproteobacteria bacterium]|nr:phosphoribosylglycinamide formyltransferase [Gammaproteobacteria bacterium]